MSFAKRNTHSNPLNEPNIQIALHFKPTNIISYWHSLCKLLAKKISTVRMRFIDKKKIYIQRQQQNQEMLKQQPLETRKENKKKNGRNEQITHHTES